MKILGRIIFISIGIPGVILNSAPGQRLHLNLCLNDKTGMIICFGLSSFNSCAEPMQILLCQRLCGYSFCTSPNMPVALMKLAESMAIRGGSYKYNESEWHGTLRKFPGLALFRSSLYEFPIRCIGASMMPFSLELECILAHVADSVSNYNSLACGPPL